MYLEHFGLFVKPFGISPQLDFLYKSAAFEESMAHLVYGLDNSEAIILITGPIGSGKTMALQSFLAELGTNYQSALVTNTQVTTIELLKLILEDLGVPLGPGWDKSDLLIAFKNLLAQSWKEGKKVIVVIDEAQNLSPDVLEEVRLLTNLGQGMEQPVQLVLVGQPELKEIVNSPDLAQLRQRIRVHYEVETLDFEEMVGYVKHRMKVAGCDREVFEPGALERLFEVSGGIPRLVNTHAGDALLSAFVSMRTTVNPQDMDEGIRSEGDGDEMPRPVEKPAPVARTPEPPVAEPPPVIPKKEFRDPDPEPIPPRPAPVTPVPEPEPAPEPAPAPAPAPERESEDVYAEYAYRRDRRSSGSGWRWILILMALLALVALAVWLSSWMGSGGSTAGLAPTDTLMFAVVDSVQPQNTIPVEPEKKVVEMAVLDEAETEIQPSDPVIQPAVITPTPEVEIEELDYYIHVASFRDSLRSKVYQGRLEDRSMAARVERDVVDGEEWFRVYIGPEPTRDSALTLANDLIGSRAIKYYKIVKLAPSELQTVYVP